MDLKGRKIKTILNAAKPSGSYQEEVDVKALSNGVYLVKMETASGSTVKKFIKY